MDWTRVQAALIRAFWTVVFPLIGGLVTHLIEPGVLEEIGVTNASIALIVGAVLYGLKKLIWPDTVL